VSKNRNQTPAPASPAPPALAPIDEPLHFGWVLIDCGHLGWAWARVRLPQSVIDAHIVGELNPPNSRPLIASKIAADIASDRILDRRGWKTPAELEAERAVRS
jgi:hypothetical protein